MKTKKSIVKVITSLLLAILILFNLNINYQVINAKDNTNSELTTNDGTNDEKKVSKVKVPTDNNISEVNGKKYVNNDILIFFKDGVKINEINNIINSIDGSIVGQVSELNEYQVKVKKSSLDELNNIISNLMNKYSNSIDFASVDYISKNTSIIPDDPWGNDNKWDEENASGNNWGLEAIQAQSAWQYNNIFDESVNKINMGVVDGGFDTTAEDFPDSYEKFSNTNYDLPHDHGTFVTSIMAAKANNNKGITGIVWNPGKIYLASASSSNYGYLTLSSLTKGLSDVVSNGAKVINCSFGGEDDDGTESTFAALFMAKMIKNGYDFIIVQASGNESCDAKYNGWFSGISDEKLNMVKSLYDIDKEEIKDRIITVGAAEEESDGSFMQADYSNIGESVDICAPGSNIYSQKAGSNYVLGNGTSYAAPHVAGVVELTWRANPDLTGTEVRNIVCDENNTIYDVPANSRCSVKKSLKMVNAKLSVENALKTRDDLITIYLNSNEKAYIKYKLETDKWSTAKNLLMNDNLDNNGYNKSITIPVGSRKYILANFKVDGKLYDNNSLNYKLTKGAYVLVNGEIISVPDKFSGLQITSFKADEGYETTVSDVVNLSTTAKNIEGECKYSFSVLDQNGNETIIKDYSYSNNASWKAETVGNYTLITKIKDSRGYEVTKSKKFKVLPIATIESFHIDSSKYGGVGKQTKVYVSLNGGKGNCSCKFIAMGGDYKYGSKSIVFNSTSDTVGSWIPDKIGTYSILCDVTDESGVTVRYKLCDYEVLQDPDYKFNIDSFNSSKTSNIEVSEDILFNFSYSGGPNNEDSTKVSLSAVNEDGTTEDIDSNDYKYKSNKLNSIKWAPTKSGKWTVTLKVGNSGLNKSTKSIDINVNEYKKTNFRNTTTIYYKGYESPYIHYAVNNENWTNVPGEKMIKTEEKEGYTHKYVIDLGEKDNVSVCFNDGNGNWDSNNGQNYKFNSGIYTYSNGNITKIGDNNSDFAISYFKSNIGNEITSGKLVNFKANIVNGTGKIKYTFIVIDSLKNEKDISCNNENYAYWTPQNPGNYKIVVKATDELGNTDTREMDFVVNEEIQIKSIDIDKKSPVLVNTPITVTINKTGGTGNVKYYYNIYNGSNLVVENDSYNNSFTFTPKSTGNYTINCMLIDECGFCKRIDYKIIVKETETDPLILYSIGKSVAGDVIKDEGVSFNIVLASFGEGKVTYSAYAICTDGTKDIIADNSSSSTLNWKPSKSGNWMIFFNINDETGQKIYYQNNLKVIDKINNTATIYYNAEDYKFDEVYFHYKVGNGEWTKAPGIKMEKTSEVDGYTHKITISLGEETNITGCFTNGKGLWDNNNSKNYELIKGCFGVSKGCINQVTEPTSLEIKKVIFNDEETYDVKYGETVKVTTKVAGNKGNCKYTVIATNTASGKIDVLSKESNDSTVSWIPSEKGGWKVTAFIEDEEGNVKCNSDYGISIN